MPLFGVPNTISPELLYALARMGHGDKLIIADANFPSDSIATTATIKEPIRMNGTTSFILQEILRLFPLDQYVSHPIAVMDRVPSDKDKNLNVPAYTTLAEVAGKDLLYIERFKFYDEAKGAFVVVQSNDTSLYANCIIYKGVVS